MGPKTVPQPNADVSGTGSPNLIVVELIGDPGKVADNVGEWIKLYNPGPVDVDLQNYKIQSGIGSRVYTGAAADAESHTIASSVVVPVGSCVVLGNNTSSTVNGGVTEAYSYGTSITMGNNNTDWVTIKSSTGALLDSVAYSTSTVSGTTRTITTPSYTIKTGISRVVIDPSQDHTVMAGSNWQDTPAATTYGAGDRGTPNTCDYTYRAPGGGPVGPITKVTVAPSTAAVNVNGTITLSARATDDNRNIVTSNASRFTWSSSNQDVATVDTAGVVTGVSTSAQPVVITATSLDAPTLSGSASITVASAPSKVTITARTVPLPVGFQAQVFANGTDQSGNAVASQTISWSSADISIATVDARGIISAAGVGSVKIRATVPDGSFGETTVTTESQFFSTSARAGHNLEFGTPTDHDASDDVIIDRKQYTISFNARRGGPNWVSWDMDATHLGSSDRCNCFTADTALVRLGHASSMYTTADYVAGGLWDRGHMEPSADQTTTDTENGATFFLTNTLPQKHDLNAGPWEKLEIALRDSAKAGREVYQIAGGVFTNGTGLGTLNDAGKIAIPDSTWKIAVIMPVNTGIAQVTSAQAVTVIAVNMPNVTGIALNGWQTYQTTVDKIQHSTGYNFLSAVPEQIQCRIEVRNCAPVAAFTIGGSQKEGGAVTFDASGTTGMEGNTLNYAWTFGDGAPGTGAQTAHTYDVAGSYNVTLVVNDGQGGADTVQHTVTVANVSPTVAPFSGATILTGETYSASGTFGDPGKDSWTATVNYGSGASALTLDGFGFQLSHNYTAAGRFTVTVTVSDSHGGSGTSSAPVIVETPSQGIQELLDAVRSAPLTQGEAASLNAKLRAASAALNRGDATPAVNMLGAFNNEIEALVASNRIDGTTAGNITSYAQRVITSIQR